MRRTVGLLVLLVVLGALAPVAPAASKACAMACAKTSACCCAKQGPDTGDTRLTVRSETCCKNAGLTIGAGPTAALPAEQGIVLASRVECRGLAKRPAAARAPRHASAPRAPPSSLAA